MATATKAEVASLDAQVQRAIEQRFRFFRRGKVAIAPQDVTASRAHCKGTARIGHRLTLCVRLAAQVQSSLRRLCLPILLSADCA